MPFSPDLSIYAYFKLRWLKTVSSKSILIISHHRWLFNSQIPLLAPLTTKLLNSEDCPTVDFLSYTSLDVLSINDIPVRNNINIYRLFASLLSLTNYSPPFPVSLRRYSEFNSISYNNYNQSLHYFAMIAVYKLTYLNLSQWLSRYSEVHLLCSYDRFISIILVHLNLLSIPSFEYQHGTINDSHEIYTKFHLVPELQPAHFLLWDTHYLSYFHDSIPRSKFIITHYNQLLNHRLTF